MIQLLEKILEEVTQIKEILWANKPTGHRGNYYGPCNHVWETANPEGDCYCKVCGCHKPHISEL